jgi:outer membrane scaffolding protein for murein synthesis (MipA/OmpV family)
MQMTNNDTKENQAMKITKWSTCLLAGLLWAGQASADDTQLTGYDEDTMPEVAQPAAAGNEWHFVAGGVAANIPRHEGASSKHGILFPLFDASYGKFFVGDLRGIGYQFVKERNLQFGVRLGGAPGRKESLDAHLAGTGDLARSGELGLFLKARNDIGYITLNTAGGKRGSHAELGAGLDFHPAMLDILRVGATVGWANADYMQAYFGIDATQAANSGLPAYQAAGGLHNYGVLTSWTHVFNRHWLGGLAVSQRHVAGSARNSPLVVDKSANVASVVALYLF